MAESLALEVIIGSIIGVAAILSPLVYRGIQYVINKNVCLTIFKNKLQKQEEETENGHQTHRDLYKEIGELKENQSALDAKVDILLHHFGLKSE